MKKHVSQLALANHPASTVPSRSFILHSNFDENLPQNFTDDEDDDDEEEEDEDESGLSNEEIDDEEEEEEEEDLETNSLSIDETVQATIST